MEIKVLGTGCSSCKALYATVLQAVNELGIDANVVKEEDLMKIMAYNVMQCGVVINEKWWQRANVVARSKRSIE